MKKPEFLKKKNEQREIELGLGSYSHRMVDDEGNFKIHQKGGGRFASLHLYQHFLRVSWITFFIYLFIGFIGFNVLFGFVYLALGPESLSVVDGTSMDFWDAFFFSVQTFTTVGYGGLSPITMGANLVSTFEAMMALIYVAVATGLVFGRFARPSSRIRFTKNILYTPFREGFSLQFRMVNVLPSMLMEVSTKVILIYSPDPENPSKRIYQLIDLDIDNIIFMALNWTVVHNIDDNSPLFGMSFEEIKKRNPEFMIMVSGIDDTFDQTIYQKHAYGPNELIEGYKWKRMFDYNDHGEAEIDFDKLEDKESLS